MIKSQTEVLLPFIVPLHDRMVHRGPGKFGDTVLTIEANIYNFSIREYGEPLSWERQWCYDREHEAFAALLVYLIESEAEEPLGWVRSIVAGQPMRRRASSEEADVGELERGEDGR